MSSENSAEKSDSEHEQDAIDIYLFNNGQQNSPPRKYHLKVDRLKVWDDTLRYLARLQYGSMNSGIELYTIDGQKLQSSAALKHNGAFVAVGTAKPFINAGYDKYLIKASRSREKRQIKKISNPELSNADETAKHSKTIKPKVQRGLLNMPKVNPNVPEENIVTNTGETDSSQIKPHTRRLGDLRKSLDTSGNSKLADKNKPISNQTNQRSSVKDTPRNSNISSTPVDLNIKKIALNRRDKASGRLGRSVISAKMRESQLNDAIAEAKSQSKTEQKQFYSNISNLIDKNPKLSVSSKPTTNPVASKIETAINNIKISRPSIDNDLKPIDDQLKAEKSATKTLVSAEIALIQSNAKESTIIDHFEQIEKSMPIETIYPAQPNSISVNDNPFNENTEVVDTIYQAQPIVIKPDPNSPAYENIEPITPAEPSNNILPNPPPKGTSGIPVNTSNKIQVSVNNQIDDVNQDKDILYVSNIYKNQDREECSSFVTVSGNPNTDQELSSDGENGPLTSTNPKNSKTDSKMPNFHDSHSNFLSTSEELKDNQTDKGDLGITELKTPDLINMPYVPPQIQTVANNEVKHGNDHLIALVSKGDVLNLKVHIELRNAEGILRTKSITTGKSSSFTDLKQGDDNASNEKLTRRKSLQSVPPHLCCQKDQRKVVVQCPCCDIYTTNEERNQIEDTNTFDTDNHPYYVLLPVMTRERIRRMNTCNTCDKQVQNTDSTYTTEYRESYCNTDNTNQTVYQTYYSMEKRDDRHDSTGRKVSIASEIDKKDTKSDEPRNSCKPSCKVPMSCQIERMDSTKRQVSMIKEDACQSDLIVVRVADRPSQTSDKIEYAGRKVSKCTNCSQIERNMRDNFTQTDWCDVMLETRAHPNGHYTFHLPPLKLLQRYRL